MFDAFLAWIDKVKTAGLAAFLAWVEIIKSLGYIGVLIAVFIESTFVPIPSEITLIPAGFAAAKGEMSITILYICSIVGSTSGALLNYWIAYRFGEPLLLRYGKYFFINKEKLNKMKRFFLKYGGISVFLGRFLPGLKHFITFPAGIARMPIYAFTLYSALGSGIWCALFLYMGYTIGENEELIGEYLKQFHYVIFAVVALAVAYHLWKHITSKRIQ